MNSLSSFFTTTLCLLRELVKCERAPKEVTRLIILPPQLDSHLEQATTVRGREERTGLKKTHRAIEIVQFQNFCQRR
ncbi:hypothetical protein K1719_043541 [Acacia pycnantha]|nr:hypothetical protein K1719_043541 [Acacia pycnantha]